MHLLEEARKFLIECLRDKRNQRENLHHWRKSWEFTVQHSLRVENLALQIMAVEAPLYTEAQTLVLRLAALLHDVARLDVDDVATHAERAAFLVTGWLDARPDLAVQVSDREYLLSLIVHHSEKDTPGPDLVHGILKDADALDEIGAMSILMCANWVDRTSPDFLADLEERLRMVELPFCDRKLAQLNTAAARAILVQKRQFIAGFASQLKAELLVPSRSSAAYGLR